MKGLLLYPTLQGPSPDEVALVEGGKQLGFEFVHRTQDGVQIRVLGVEATFQILNIMDFTSDRGRMSVIARCPDGTIRLFCKGADTKVLAIVNPATQAQLLEATNKNMHLFATQAGFPAWQSCSADDCYWTDCLALTLSAS